MYQIEYTLIGSIYMYTMYNMTKIVSILTTCLMQSLVSTSFLYLHRFSRLLPNFGTQICIEMKLEDSFTNSTAVIWGLNVPH